jgi:hypothetical protein
MARMQLIFLYLVTVTVCGKAVDDVRRPIVICKGECAQVQTGEVQTGVGISKILSLGAEIPLPPVI